MVSKPPPINLEVRVSRVRYLCTQGNGAILVATVLNNDGQGGRSVVLQIDGFSMRDRATFHVSQSLKIRGRPGEWENPRTGRIEQQLKVVDWHSIRPRGAAFVEYVAHSPMFEGIGIAAARAVWDCFGTTIFTLLANDDLDAIVEGLPSLGGTRARKLIDGWKSAGQERLVEWLDNHRLPKSLCASLCAAYDGEDSVVDRLTADPYRLLAFGTSWRKVDHIALNSFGIDNADPRRLHAAAVSALQKLYHEGHTGGTAAMLLQGTAAILGDEELARTALHHTFEDGGFVRPSPNLFQLRGAWAMERAIAIDLGARTAAHQHAGDLDQQRIEDALDKFQDLSQFQLTPQQRRAVSTAFLAPVSVIIGGAGTGKTACLKALHYLVETITNRSDAVIQMALSGRAAKRIREGTARPALTIAGFLDNLKGEAIREATHIVIDEGSMLDVANTHRILRRLRGKKKLVLVGDEFQLPPIGAGKVLHLLADRDTLPVEKLEYIWRQAAGNPIQEVSRDVRLGKMASIPQYNGVGEGVSLCASGNDPIATAAQVFLELSGGDTRQDVCVIVPTRAGKHGALGVNQNIKPRMAGLGHVVRATHPGGAQYDTGFRLGDRFVCDVNCWDVDLMNGTIGHIVRLAAADEVATAEVRREELEAELKQARLNRDHLAVRRVQTRLDKHFRPLVCVEFDGKERLIGEHHLRMSSMGYGLTCHRAQGSDFERVVVLVDGAVDRSWLYTAITRARTQVVLVASERHLSQAISRAPLVNERTVGLEALLDRELSCGSIANAA